MWDVIQYLTGLLVPFLMVVILPAGGSLRIFGFLNWDSEVPVEEEFRSIGFKIQVKMIESPSKRNLYFKLVFLT